MQTEKAEEEEAELECAAGKAKEPLATSGQREGRKSEMGLGKGNNRVKDRRTGGGVGDGSRQQRRNGKWKREKGHTIDKRRDSWTLDRIDVRGRRQQQQ